MLDAWPAPCRLALVLLLAACVAAAAGPAPAAPTDLPPILVTGMVHIDPIASPPDSAIAIQSYLQHRAALAWYVDLAAQTGLRLSAQMTGVYAEACVRQDDAADFTAFMPGGPHHLATHLHANVKGPGPYSWRTLPQFAYALPDSVRRVMADNIPWVNRLFVMNGHTSADNWFFHGTHASYPGMEEDLWCLTDPGSLPYDNCYTMAAALRGGHYVYRGGFALEPSQTADTSYVKLPEVGGIIGFDQVHGPEGMVYGTVPYQKRDFLRVYMEWRESVRRGEPRAVRYFNWMIHPYQLLPGTIGTDGRPPRLSIVELVDWLRANFIEHADESGQVMARFANAAEIRAAYESWRGTHPDAAAALQATLAAGDRPLHLPAIFDRLDTAFYVERTASADPDLVLHRLTDRVSGGALYAAWSRAGWRPLEPALSGTFRVLHGDGTEIVLGSASIMIGEEPVLLERTAATAVAGSDAPGLVSLLAVAPNPASNAVVARFVLARPEAVALGLVDVHGRLVAALPAAAYAAGAHQVAVETAGLPAGVYWLRLTTQNSVVSHKFLIER